MKIRNTHSLHIFAISSASHMLKKKFVSNHQSTEKCIFFCCDIPFSSTRDVCWCEMSGKIALNLRYRPFSENNGNEAMKLLFHLVIFRASSAGCFQKLCTVRCGAMTTAAAAVAVAKGLQWRCNGPISSIRLDAYCSLRLVGYESVWEIFFLFSFPIHIIIFEERKYLFENSYVV